MLNFNLCEEILKYSLTFYFRDWYIIKPFPVQDDWSVFSRLPGWLCRVERCRDLCPCGRPAVWPLQPPAAVQAPGIPVPEPPLPAPVSEHCVSV